MASYLPKDSFQGGDDTIFEIKIEMQTTSRLHTFLQTPPFSKKAMLTLSCMNDRLKIPSGKDARCSENDFTYECSLNEGGIPSLETLLRAFISLFAPGLPHRVSLTSNHRVLRKKLRNGLLHITRMNIIIFPLSHSFASFSL